jgi:hypothetical protein
VTCEVALKMLRKTDYVLVPIKKLQEAIRALKGDGWVFEQELKSRL